MQCPHDISFVNDDDEELKDFEENYFSHYPNEEADVVSEIPEEKSESDLPCEGCAYDINSCCNYPETSDDYCVCGDKRIPKSEADKPAENQIATTTETTLQDLFDYSELDNDTAKNLRECERIIRQETAGYFTLLGAKFKEAQSLLADHASGTFEKWYTAMGFKRQTVYNLIQRYDFFGSPTIGGREDTFEALPLTLSYEVSKPDAPAELVEKVLDGDITTNAEYLKLKAELDRTREECRQLDANSAAKDKEYERQIEEANEKILLLQSTIDQKDGEIDGRRAVIGTLEAEKETLEKEIEELQSRPVDVAVQDNSELMEELEQLREENERLKNKDVKNMIISLSMDEFSELIKALGRKPQLQDIIKRAKIIKL